MFQCLIAILIFNPRSCTIVQQQTASSGSDKSSETTETQNVTDAKQTNEDEAVVIDQKGVTEAQTEEPQTGETEAQTEDKQEPADDLKQSAIDSSEDKDEEIIQAIRVEDEVSEENEEAQAETVPQSVVETSEDSAELIIQAVRVPDEPADEGKIEATQEEDTKSISSESSGLIYILHVYDTSVHQQN